MTSIMPKKNPDISRCVLLEKKKPNHVDDSAAIIQEIRAKVEDYHAAFIHKAHGTAECDERFPQDAQRQ